MDTRKLNNLFEGHKCLTDWSKKEMINNNMKFKEPHKPLCRVCLRCSSQIQDNVSSIYSERNGYVVCKMINYIANVDIQPDDGLLDKICAECIVELDNAILFRQKCEESNRLLLSNLRFNELNKKDQQQEMEGSLKFEKALSEQKKPQQLAAVSLKSVRLKQYDELKQETVVNYHEQHPSNDYVTSSPLPDDNTQAEKQTQELNYEAAPPKRIRIIDLKLICHDCGESFRTKCKLRVHWKKVHQPRTLTCNVCKMQFKSYKALHTHKKRKLKSCITAGKSRIEGEGRSRRFYCKDCDYATHRIGDMTNHLNIHTGERPWSCKLCPKAFTQQSVLQSHLESYHKNYLTELTCHLCGKHCKGRSAIYRHMVTHQKSTYECDICGIILTRRNSLLLHLKRHSDKSYFCEICPSRFYTSYELHSHKVRVHYKTKKIVRKRFHCDLCAYNTSHNKILKKHRFKHSDSNIACEKCGKFFEDEEELNVHKRQHLNGIMKVPSAKMHTTLKRRIHVKRRHKINLVSSFSSKNPDVKKEVDHGHYYDISSGVVQ